MVGADHELCGDRILTARKRFAGTLAYTSPGGKSLTTNGWVHESVLVRRTYREGGKVRHEALASLSALPAEAVAA
jgi:hypothetical protein